MSRKSALLRWSVVLGVLLSGVFFSLHVSINDNALDLLPDGAVKGDLELLQRLGLVDRLFITLSVDEKEYLTEAAAQKALKKSVEKLGNTLRANDFFSLVVTRLPQGYESRLFNTLQTYLPVLLDEKDFAEIEHLTSVAGLEKVMQQNFELINSPAGIGMKQQVQRDPLGLTRLLLNKLIHLQTEFSMQLEDGFFMSKDRRSCLVFAESKLPLTDSKGAQTIEHELKNAFGKALTMGVEARIIGSLPHTLANSRSIQRDLRLLLPVATILLLLLLGVTFKNIRAFIVLSVPFMAAPPAIALTTLFFGNISALALGFGIVLLGIAVDFSIHLYLTLSREEGTQEKLLHRIRRPVIFATLTTTAVFIILLFSEVPSHRQMATLALSGVLLAVLFAWLVIPTIVSQKGRKKNSIEPMNCFLSYNASDIRHLSPLLQKGALSIWIILLVAGFLSWPQLRYNGDLRVLDVPDREVLADEHHFNVTWGQKGDQAFVIGVGKNLEEALDVNSLIYHFLRENNFDTFQSLAPILPGPGVQKNNLKLWRQFWQARRPAFDKQFAAVSQNKGFSEQAFALFFHQLERDPGLLFPESLSHSPLQPMLETMVRSFSTAKESGGENQFLVMSTVAIDDDTLPLLLAFAEQNSKINVLANKKWRAEVEQLLRKDIVLLCFAAGCAIFFLVALQFRKIDVTFAVLAPVLSSLAAMSLFCWIIGGELNMMHLIMGIMVIGLSVDYGIFVACSRLTGDTGTASMAVSICACSSLIGFGVLAFAHHPALHSLGITVLVGIGAAWPVALFVSPFLIKKESRVVQ